MSFLLKKAIDGKYFPSPNLLLFFMNALSFTLLHVTAVLCIFFLPSKTPINQPRSHLLLMLRFFCFFYVVSSPAVVEKNILKKALAPDSSFQMYYKHKKSSEIEILKQMCRLNFITIIKYDMFFSMIAQHYCTTIWLIGSVVRPFIETQVSIWESSWITLLTLGSQQWPSMTFQSRIHRFGWSKRIRNYCRLGWNNTAAED